MQCIVYLRIFFSLLEIDEASDVATVDGVWLLYRDAMLTEEHRLGMLLCLGNVPIVVMPIGHTHEPSAKLNIAIFYFFPFFLANTLFLCLDTNISTTKFFSTAYSGNAVYLALRRKNAGTRKSSIIFIKVMSLEPLRRASFLGK